MPEPTEILEAALQQEFEHAPYTYLGIRQPDKLTREFEPQAVAAFFEADDGKWAAYRPFLPYELEAAAVDPEFIAERVREEIDAFYNRDFN